MWRRICFEFVALKKSQMEEATLKQKLISIINKAPECAKKKKQMDKLNSSFDDTVAVWKDYDVEKNWDKFFAILGVTEEDDRLEYSVAIHNAFPRDKGKKRDSAKCRLTVRRRRFCYHFRPIPDYGWICGGPNRV